MKPALLMVCIGGVSFLLRVLAALIKEFAGPRHRAVEAYLANVYPLRKRAELIVMNPNVSARKVPIKTGERIALGLLLIAGFAIPVHGQKAINGPQPANPTGTEATANSPQLSQEVLQELDAMKKRIEQLEAQLKERGSADPPAAAVDWAKASTPSPSLSGASAARGAVALQTEAAPPAKPPTAEPFAFADWTWLNGNPRTKEAAFDSKFFTPEVRVDVAYHYDFNHPKDDTIGGSSEVFRSNEVGLTHLGLGGDFHFDHVRARVLSQIGLYATATPRNDASYSRGQWQLDNAYRYVSEAYGGYHFDALHGINVDAGIFLSYVGLFSFYNFDNWAYQPSYVSSNTPWFFTGMRIQVFPTEKLKIEPWIINGWQSYGRYNGRLGVGGQVLYRPTGWLSMLSNDYGLGADALGIPNRTRYHTDNSIEVKYYDHPDRFLDKMAFSLTGDAGCESGGGVNCTTNQKNAAGQIVSYKQSFLGFMIYNRWWFKKDRYGFTLGGGKINNPGRYLVLLPPIDGATASTGSPYFTENPGDPFKAWDVSATYDYMPSQYITFRWEFNHRHANVPYWTGPGGITPPGGNDGNPGAIITGWQPDLRRTEDRGTMAILVKF
ncbi:MAG TPA: outer membrane beta-barrel protein [Candidatus Sulfotelmatobacter sp.]|nr:outer membrane beta-barrel protein [Candidatus Sulfotelmatobacter sp.]